MSRNESKFDQFSFILDEIFQKETNHKYNLFQTDKQNDCCWMMSKKLEIQLLGLPPLISDDDAADDITVHTPLY